MVKLVATVSSNEEIKFADVADIIEIRVDLFRERPIRPDKNLILTCRRKADGGRFDREENERIACLMRWVEELKPEYIDIECDVPEKHFDFFASSSTIIESYHNFWETPDYSYLRELVESSRGDYFKIATAGRGKEDVEKIVRLLCNHENVVAFLMGEKFAFTRILSAFLDSPFIYCFVGEKKAPGQIELNTARSILELLGLK